MRRLLFAPLALACAALPAQADDGLSLIGVSNYVPNSAYIQALVRMPAGNSVGSASRIFTVASVSASTNVPVTSCPPVNVSGFRVASQGTTPVDLGTAASCSVSNGATPCSGITGPCLILNSAATLANGRRLTVGTAMSATDTCNLTMAFTFRGNFGGNQLQTGQNWASLFGSDFIAHSSLSTSSEGVPGIDLTEDANGVRINIGNAAATGVGSAIANWTAWNAAFIPGGINQLVASIDSCYPYTTYAYMAPAMVLNGVALNAPTSTLSAGAVPYAINWSNAYGLIVNNNTTGASAVGGDFDIADLLIWTGSAVSHNNLVCTSGTYSSILGCPATAQPTGGAGGIVQMSPNDLAQFGSQTAVSTQITTTANYGTGVSQITLGAACPATVGPGQIVIDTSNGNANNGVVLSCVGTTLTLTANNAVAINAATVAHTLQFYTWKPNNPSTAVAAFQSRLGSPQVEITGPASVWNNQTNSNSGVGSAFWPSYPAAKGSISATYTLPCNSGNSICAGIQDVNASAAYVSGLNPGGEPPGKGGFKWAAWAGSPADQTHVLASTGFTSTYSNGNQIAAGDLLVIAYYGYYAAASPTGLNSCALIASGITGGYTANAWTAAGTGGSTSSTYSQTCYFYKIAAGADVGVNVTFTLGAVETGGTAPTSASNTVLLDYASNGPTNTWRIDPNLTSASFSTYTATSGQTYPICATSTSTACSSGGLPTLGGSNDVLIFLYGFVNGAYYSPFGCPVTTNPALGSAPISKRFDSFAAQGNQAPAPNAANQFVCDATITAAGAVAGSAYNGWMGTTYSGARFGTVLAFQPI